MQLHPRRVAHARIQKLGSSSRGALSSFLASSIPSPVMINFDDQISSSETAKDAGVSLPSGWPSFVSAAQSSATTKIASRGGLFDDNQLTRQLADATYMPQTSPRIQRPETPILAYVDRASMPGFVDTDECEFSYQQLDRDRKVQEISSWSPEPVTQVTTAEQWEADLIEWKRRYGCPDVLQDDGSSPDISVGAVSSAPLAPAGEMNALPPALEAAQDHSLAGLVGASEESMTKTDIDLLEMSVSPPLHVSPALPVSPQPQTTTSILQSALGQSSGASLRNAADFLDQSQREDQAHEEERRMQERTIALQRAEEQSHRLREELQTLQRAEDDESFFGSLATARRIAEAEGANDDSFAGSETQPLALLDVTQQAGGFAVAASPQIVPVPPSTSPPSEARPGNSRYSEYTAQDLEVAAESALVRVKANGRLQGQFSEGGMQKRDLFMDMRKQREKDKGRQATGPLWVHLATKAKNLTNTMDLPEVLEALKLFASVRFEDYELYMRLLGEVPHYVAQATAAQLCELIRILARRRLRERNYVDMVAAHILHKIRVTDDALPPRHLVKTGNAFAALEIRSNPKFVEHFLRHMEHRLHELDGSLCCLVAPIFLDQYMNDALRRAYLCRCAETHAGFECPLEDARNIACIELILRKEHHSLVVSLPPHVHRYLDKVQRHAQFDKWGAVTIPISVAPDGPKGGERAEMSLALQHKASTADSAVGRQADVFSSDMHRDVSACLSHLGIDHENGVLAGPYLLDVVAMDMVTPSKRIVYEINSAHHYYEGTQQLTAEKRLRHRMIGRLGHKVHMVNVEDWSKISSAQKMTLMLKMQQTQQEQNFKEEKAKAATNAMRTPLPALQSAHSDTLRLKSVGDLRQPIRVPVPPSVKARQVLGNR